MKKQSILLFCFVGLIFNSNAQITNADFEQGDSVNGFYLPSGWGGDQGWGSGVSPHNHSGGQAMSVWTWYTYLAGYIYNTPQTANIGQWQQGGTPISSKPTSLSGWYDYEDSAAAMVDSAIAKVLLKKWNTTTQSIDTIGYGELKLPGTSGFTAFDIPIMDLAPGITPDSICIYFASKANNSYCNLELCQYLYIDDLALNTPTGIQAYDWPSKSNIAPNPASNDVQIAFNENTIKIEIIDGTGRVVYEAFTQGNNVSNLSVNNWKQGVYFVRQIASTGEVSTERLVVAR